ncbi:hypothetical protein [Peptoniphilus sp. HCN-40583]|uniref:hypothetical protein n=1 Tax=Peptoniphilus sp. HCN-40583 TaxID=3134662 RepID=UPI0030C552B1
MQTVELEKLIKGLGLDAEYKSDIDDDDEETEMICAMNGDELVALAYIDHEGLWECKESELERLETYKRHALIDGFIEYAQTPTSERWVPKKYYLKHKWILKNYGGYLSIREDTGEVFLLGSNWDDNVYAMTFTKEEIENIKRKYETDLKEFEMIEA